MPKRNYDTIAKAFVQDAKRVLEEHDIHVRNKFFRSSEVDGFYKDRYKGIATWSTNEPILKYILFTELCDKYKMRPEDRAYNGAKLLDLSLFVDERNESNQAEIGIEMKWAAITNKSLMTAGSLQCFVDDFVKIKDAMATHKYLLQFAHHKPTVKIDPIKIEQQIIEQKDKRAFRYFSTKIISIEQFLTRGSNEEEQIMFSILLWKVQKNSEGKYNLQQKCSARCG
jgi:hypothetical protein